MKDLFGARFLDRKYFQSMIPILFVCGIVLFDYIIRYSYFNRMLFPDAFFYSLSILFEVSVILVFLRIAGRSALFGYIFLVVYLFGLVATSTFYVYFKTLPGVNTFSYMYLEPEDFFGIAGDGVNFWYMLLATAILVAIWRPVKVFMSGNSPCSKRVLVVALITIFAGGALLNRAIADKDSRAMPITNSIFSIYNGYRDFRHGKFASYELMHRSINLSHPETRRIPSCNLLVVINESLSAQYLEEYGYSLNTMPHISDFLGSHPKNTFVFPRAFSNATITKLSVPSIMTGLNPIEGRHHLGKSPLFYEILKNNLASYRTGMMTSWSYNAANFVEFMSSPYLDYYQYLENSGAKKICNVAGDDSLIAADFQTFLDGRKSGEKFCAVLHYANTHYPYFSKPGDTRFNLPNRMLNDYLASVHNLDHNISVVLDTLRDQGLLDNTVVIFTSDHGESFGEVDKRSGHLGMFNVYTTRVPFWMYIPETVLASHPEYRGVLERNMQRNVTNNDIFPTILGLYGLDKECDSRFGLNLFADVPDNRDIFVFNGLKENRTDNREYVGIIRKDAFFAVEKEFDYGLYHLYDFRDISQIHNIWGQMADRDSTFIASLRSENLDLFVLKPPVDPRVFLALMDRHWVSEFLKRKLNQFNQPIFQ